MIATETAAPFQRMTQETPTEYSLTEAYHTLVSEVRNALLPEPDKVV